MSKLILNFFGESIEVSKPKNLANLRKQISIKFFLRPKDADEVLLSYFFQGKKISISNESDFKEFLKSKVNKIDFDIDEKSRIFEENLLKIQEEKEKDQKIMEDLLNKNKELENLKKTKYAEDLERIKNINLKIIFFTAMKKKIQKDVDQGIKSIDKEIKENEIKIKNLQKKLNATDDSKVPDFSKLAECKKMLKRRFDHRTNMTKAIKAKTKPLIGDLKFQHEDNTQTISWTSYVNAKSYDVYHAESRFAEYTKIATVDDTTFTYELKTPNKYANYYKVAVAGSDQLSDPISAEIDLFGENVHIYASTDDRESIYNEINAVYNVQAAVDSSGNPTTGQQFGNGRHTFAFKKGDYSTMNADNYNISYYMQIIGLGKVPSEVKLKNIHVPAVLPDSNVTCNFWMNIENFEVIEENVYHSDDVWFNLLWSVSQAAPARRLNVKRPCMLDWYYGWASGGYIADSYFHGAVGSYSQQQYYLRNCTLSKNWYGCNWNLVSQGVSGISTTNTYNLESGLGVSNWKSGKPYTFLNNTDLVREKPFLFFDDSANEYKVFAPALRTRTVGPSWNESNMGNGTTYSINDFYVAKATKDNASTINAALSQGKHILLTPGLYYAEAPIKVERENTIILGLGLATIIPSQNNKDCAIRVSDVGGVTIAGVILDAQYSSENMIVVGTKGNTTDHSSNPVILQDLFVRIGGVHDGVASCHQSVVINSNNCIGDDFWLWRADHGSGVGWNLNTAQNGLVVNADNVIMYGLMVEHFQEYDIIWRGENGKTYFLQNEKCYDPQNQNDWKSHNNSLLGYAAYKVCNKVKNHYAVGLGSYDVFINTGGASIFLDNPFEVPDTSGVRIENACIVEIANASGPLVGFNHIINGVGPGTSTGQGGKGYARQCLISYNNTKALVIDDYYAHGSSESGIINTETGKQTSDDPKADEVTVKKNSCLHSGVECKGCGMFPIVGCRYKCNLCEDFNYCEKCEAKFAEEHNHPFIKIYNSEMENDFLI